jgi:1-pyrroline-5-carboxylate dehydrogenase
MFITVPVPKNEQLNSYAPGTCEREKLKKALHDLSNDFFEIPAIINGKEVLTGNLGYCIDPHNHKHILAKYHKVGQAEIDMAIEAAMKATTTGFAQRRMELF